MTTDTNKLKTISKHLRHDYTPTEKAELGISLAQLFAESRGIEAEFSQVKDSYKSKLSEKAASVEKISTDMVNGFDMRNQSCVVVLRPKDRKKDYYLEEGFNEKAPGKPVLIEEMTPNDFQQELIEAEGKFEKREEIVLFPPTERDRGILVVGMFNHKWYSALRITVGRHQLEERLDSEQKSFKKRFDAIHSAAQAGIVWFEKVMAKDAPGFKPGILNAVAAQKERVE